MGETALTTTLEIEHHDGGHLPTPHALKIP
jgi:hypothetical protein